MTDASGPLDIAGATVTGLRWRYATTLVAVGTQVVYTAVLSRLLTPAAFGLMAIASLAVTFSRYFALMGVGHAIVQREEIDRDHLRAGMAIALASGLAAAGILWLVAPWIAGLFQKPGAAPLLRVLGLGFVPLGIASVPQSILRRQLAFRDVVVLETIGFVLGYAGVGITAGVLGAGVWSLVAATLSAQVLVAVALVVRVRPPLLPSVRLQPYRDLLSFGMGLSVFQFLHFGGNNLDTFTIGRVGTAATLGQYNRAYFLVIMPLEHLTAGLAEILFPGFSRIQADRERLRRVYRDAFAVAAALLVPTCVGIAIAGSDLVRAVLGDQWELAASLMGWIGAAAAFHVLTRVATSMTTAAGQIASMVRLQVVHLVVLAGALFAAALVGEAWAFAAALLAGEITRHLLYVVLTTRTLGYTRDDLLRSYRPAVAASAVVALAIVLMRQLVTALGAGPGFRLAAQVLAGAAGLLIAIRLPMLRKVRHEIASRLTATVAGSSRARRVVALALGPPRVEGQP